MTVPTLIVFGREDRVIPAEYGAEFARLIAGSRLEVIERVRAHPVAWSASSATKELVGEFLRGVSAHGVEIGLLILRVVTGLAWCGHGTQKLFGWFGAKARGTLEDEFTHFGYHPPLLFGRLAGVTELTAGLLLATGFATPVGAGLLAAVSVQAIAAVKWPNGPWIQDDGYEYLLLLAAIGISLRLRRRRAALARRGARDGLRRRRSGRGQRRGCGADAVDATPPGLAVDDRAGGVPELILWAGSVKGLTLPERIAGRPRRPFHRGLALPV